MNETQAPHAFAVAASGEPRSRQDLVRSLKECARERPELVALWCLAAGFILGWKLKPW